MEAGQADTSREGRAEVAEAGGGPVRPRAPGAGSRAASAIVRRAFCSRGGYSVDHHCTHAGDAGRARSAIRVARDHCEGVLIRLRSQAPRAPPCPMTRPALRAHRPGRRSSRCPLRPSLAPLPRSALRRRRCTVPTTETRTRCRQGMACSR